MNYYSILELEKDCSLEDIKKAYHRLSLIYHPDLSRENSEKFLEIKNAYDYLKNNHKSNHNESSYNKMWSNIFKNVAKNKLYHFLNINISLEEAISGFNREVSVKLEVPCSCTIVTRSICKKCSGLGYKKENIKSNIKIDSLSQQDQVVEFPNFYENIDLKISFHIISDNVFKYRGKNTESVENISIFKAILGGKFKVRVVGGGEEYIDIPEGNISDFSIKLKGRGIFGGDHLIKLKVFLPKNLTKEQNKILNKLYEETKQ